MPILVGVIAGIAETLGELTGYAAGYGGSPLFRDKSFYPRVHRPGQLNVEPGIAESTRAALGILGHAVAEAGACGIGAVVTHRDPRTGILSAGADPRRPTYALAC